MSYYKDRRVLVTGCSGLVGMALTRDLAAQGAKIRALVHHLQPAIRYPGVEYVTGDITNKDDCARITKDQELVFLCAASTSGAAAIASTPLIHVTPNIVANALMLEAAYESGVEKVLYFSSTTGYPDRGARPVREDEMFLEEPPDVYFAAGWMKRYTEILCRLYSQKLKRTMCVQVIRPTNIYGPFDDFRWETSHVLPALIRKVIEGHDPVEIWGTGDDVRDLVHVDDLVHAAMLILEKSNTYDPVNVGLGKGYSVKEMFKLVATAAGKPNLTATFNADRPSMIPIRLIDTSKAESYGYKAAIDLPEGIRRTIDWLDANPHWEKRR